MKILLAILAMLVTALATLTAIVFCLAGTANSTPAQRRAIQSWMIALSLLAMAGVVSGILLLHAGQPGSAAIAGIAPAALLGVIVVVAVFH